MTDESREASESPSIRGWRFLSLTAADREVRACAGAPNNGRAAVAASSDPAVGIARWAARARLIAAAPFVIAAACLAIWHWVP
jgi:hypothetical protein